jgi:hypothetical protein
MRYEIPGLILTREQVAFAVRAQNRAFPQCVYKGDRVVQRCDYADCQFAHTFKVKKEGMVGWSDELIDHMYENRHYLVVTA